MTLQVVTANRLTDGLVVYLVDEGNWSLDLDAAAVADDDAAAEALLEAAKRDIAARRVVDPYLVKVERDGDGLRTFSAREVIRASHRPTINPPGERPQPARGGEG